MEIPALVTVSMENYRPRYTELMGLENAFDGNDVIVLSAAVLGINASLFKNKGSRTKVRKVFLRKAQKENVILQGAASAVVTEFLNQYQRKISTAIGKSIEEKNLSDEE
jgi:electron transfer flavoprotein alpha/beta subunit